MCTSYVGFADLRDLCQEFIGVRVLHTLTLDCVDPQNPFIARWKLPMDDSVLSDHVPYFKMSDWFFTIMTTSAAAGTIGTIGMSACFSISLDIRLYTTVKLSKQKRPATSHGSNLFFTSGIVLNDIGILHIDYCGLHSSNISIYWVVGGTVFIAILDKCRLRR